MKKIFLLPLGIAALLALNSCGGNKEEKEEPENAMEALQQFAEEAKENANKEPVDPVDFRELKALLPEKMLGMERTESSGEKSGAMGFTISNAKAEYENKDDNATIRVELMDTGGIAGVATMALAAWTMADIDKETATGYEKTTKINGHKAYEQYDNERKSGELNVMVARRFIVNVNASNVSADQMKAVISELDLDKLEDLK